MKRDHSAPAILISFLILLGIVWVVVGAAVFAQENDPVSNDQPASESGETIIRTTGAETVVYQKSQLEADIEEVKRTYRGQLAEYREAENNHRIAKGQFEQLNTLSSLETAVTATRQVMIQRDRVLETYFKLLELELLNAESLNVEYRETALNQVEAVQKALIRHREQVQVATDRSSINQAVVEFEGFVEPIDFVAAFSRSVLELARFQALYDKSIAFYNRLEKEVETSQQERAYSQVGEQLERVNQLLAQADLIVVEYMAESKNNALQLDREIEVLFANMNQSLIFMEELVGSLL